MKRIILIAFGTGLTSISLLVGAQDINPTFIKDSELTQVYGGGKHTKDLDRKIREFMSSEDFQNKIAENRKNKNSENIAIVNKNTLNNPAPSVTVDVRLFC